MPAVLGLPFQGPWFWLQLKVVPEQLCAQLPAWHVPPLHEVPDRFDHPNELEKGWQLWHGLLGF